MPRTPVARDPQQVQAQIAQRVAAHGTPGALGVCDRLRQPLPDGQATAPSSHPMRAAAALAPPLTVPRPLARAHHTPKVPSPHCRDRCRATRAAASPRGGSRPDERMGAAATPMCCRA
eukprot:6723900-Prymnesium_polylepis.2